MKDMKIAMELAAKAGGEKMLEAEKGELQVDEKSGVADVVTSADLASEAAIVEVLRKAFPNEIVLSEESPEEERSALSPGRIGGFTGFVIDPIDGTNSFRHHMNYSGVSVGYLEKGEPLLGVIYDPYRRELLVAEKGKGAWLDGKRVHVSEKRSFDAATRVAFTNSYEQELARENFERHLRLPVVPWTELLGSAVLIMREVACGRLDLYHMAGLKPWDNSAGFLAVREAGGVVLTFEGAPAGVAASALVMGNEGLVREFLRLTSRQ